MIRTALVVAAALLASLAYNSITYGSHGTLAEVGIFQELLDDIPELADPQEEALPPAEAAPAPPVAAAPQAAPVPQAAPPAAPVPPAPVEFKVDGPAEAGQGELVVLKIMFPPGTLADATLTPVEEDNFEADPIVSVMNDGTVRIVGKKVSFSTRCAGTRTITVMASTVIMLPNGQPVLGAIKHRVVVGGPQPPPGNPPGDDGGWIPIPEGATANADILQKLEEIKADLEETKTKTAVIFDAVLDRLEAVEGRASAKPAPPVAKAPTPAPAQAAPAAPHPHDGVDIASLGPGWVIRECGVPVTPYRLGQSPTQVAVAPAVQAPLRQGVVPARNLPSGGRWTIENIRNPSYGDVVGHLREPLHAPFSAQYEPLTQYSFGQLRYIHDTHHDQLSGRGYSMPSQRYIQPLQRPRILPFRGRTMRAGGCPGGVCPT
jgi:hypothetical protein